MDSTINSKNVQNLGAAWVFQIPVGLSAFGSANTMPVIMGNTVYFQDLVLNIYALDLQTGNLKWKVENNWRDNGPNGVAVGYGKVFAPSSVYTFAAYDINNGNKIWETPISGIDVTGADLPGLVDCRIHRRPEGLLKVESPVHAEARVGHSGVDALVGHRANLLARGLGVERPVPEPERCLAAHRGRIAPELENLLDRGGQEATRRSLAVSLDGLRTRSHYEDEANESKHNELASADGIAIVLGIHVTIVPAPSPGLKEQPCPGKTQGKRKVVRWHRMSLRGAQPFMDLRRTGRG